MMRSRAALDEMMAARRVLRRRRQPMFKSFRATAMEMA